MAKDNAELSHIRRVVLQQGAQRYATRTQATMMVSSLPRTDAIAILTMKQAIRGLFMETAAHYLKRTEQGVAMPRAVSAQLLALHGALYDSGARAQVLTDAVQFFVHSEATVASQGVRDAIVAARLALVALQDTSAELPAVKPWTL